ncbi:MAG TPA: hypothetical protein VFN22_05280 [Gemmatimonadales bacterium]|nr:hypothetical protein [Gemmatimonadales bacterium]
MTFRTAAVCHWALALPGALVAQGYAPLSSGVEEAVVSLELARLDERIITVDRDGGIAWIPLTEVAALTGYGYHDGTDHAALLQGKDEIATFRAGSASRSTRSGWVVRSDSLARQLGIDIQVDWQELRIVLIDPGTTPVARRIAREKRQRELLREAASTPLTARASRPLIDGLAVEYGLGFASNGSPDRFTTTVGTSVLGGGLRLQIDQATATRIDGSWTSAWTGERAVSQLRLGDGVSSGPHPRTLRGVALSNARLTRFEDLGDLPVTGQVGAGWEVEAYRGGRLVAVQQADALGHYRFDVPVRIGENPVSVVAYGPSGERRESSRSLTIDDDITRPGRFEYAVSAGECRTTECRFTGNLDARWGMARGWTLRGGYDAFTRDTAPSLQHPYAGITGRLTNQFWVEGEAVANASRRVGLRYEPSAAFNVRSEYFRFDDGVRQPILTIPGRTEQLTTSAFWRPRGIYGTTSFELSTDYVTGTSGTQTSARFTASLNQGRLRMLPSARLLRTEQAGRSVTTRSVGMTAMLFPGVRGSGIPLLGKALIRTTVEGDPTGEGLQTIGAYASWPSYRTGQLEVGATWNRLSGTALSVRSTLSLGGARLYGSVTRRPDGSVETNPYLQGMLYLDPTGGVRASAETGGDRAGVTGVVWVDSDGDGVQDPDEVPAAGVRIEIGARSVLTDENGRYETFGFAPYIPVRMSIDSMTFPSPLLVASLPDSGIAVAPFRLERIDLPLAPGGVLDGRIDQHDGTPAANTDVEMCRIGTRDCRAMRSYGDGGLYELGIRAGTWEIRSGGVVLDSVTIRAGQSSAVQLRLPITPTALAGPEAWQRPIVPLADLSPPSAGDVAANAQTGVTSATSAEAATTTAVSGADQAVVTPPTPIAPRAMPDGGADPLITPSPDMRPDSTTQARSPTEAEVVATPLGVIRVPLSPVDSASVLRAREWLERRDPFDRPRRAPTHIDS